MLNQKNIVIEGKPLSKARPRFRRHGNKVITYNSQSKEEKSLGWKLRDAYVDQEPLEGPVDLNVLFVFEKTKSKNINDYHTTVPDIDNLLKFLCDAANGILWRDDRQVARMSASKIYGESARTIITVSEIDED